MKQSRFNILVVPPEAPHQAILYNTFHDHRLVVQNINNEIVDFFARIDQQESLSDDELALAKQFHELGILLDDSANEKAIFDHWYTEKIQNPEGLLNLILVTTMACNLRCPYCYEKNQLDNSRHMTRETALQFIAWVKQQVRTKPIEDVEIVYFGGEPLMNKKILFEISEELQKFCKEFGISYQGKMVSNGVLMTPKVAHELRRVGIRKIKITIDGDKECHDTTRITASGKGSFDTIWYNLSLANSDLAPGEEPIQFIIGGNFLDQTYEGFFPLLDKLATSAFKQYIVDVNLKPVQEVSLSENTELSSNPCDLVCFNETNTSRMIKLREELRKRDLPVSDGLDLGPCDFYRGDSFALGLDGTIYPCIAFVDNKSCATGHITEEKPKADHAQKQKDWEEAKPWTEDCYDCSFLPVCVGGCRATAYSNGYDWTSAVCEKEYFKRMSTALTKELLGIESETEPEGVAATTLPNQTTIMPENISPPVHAEQMQEVFDV